MSLELPKELLKEIGKKHWKKIQEDGVLFDGEQIIGAVTGWLGEDFVKFEGKVLVTDRRLIVYQHSGIESYKFDQITSMKKEIGLVNAKLIFTVAGNAQVIHRIDKKKIDAFHRLLQEQIHKPPPIKVAQPTGAKFCGECGTPLNPGVKFCSNCGTPVQ